MKRRHSVLPLVVGALGGMAVGVVREQQEIWALKHADGTWRAPDHFVNSRTSDSKSAKPFYGESGKHDAGLFQKISPDSEVVPHPHPELWG